MQQGGVKQGEIGGNIGEYRGNMGFAHAILEKRNIEISPTDGFISTYPGIEDLGVVSFRDSPEHFCISRFSKKLERFFKNLTPPPRRCRFERGGGGNFFPKIDVTFLFLEILIFCKLHRIGFSSNQRMSRVWGSKMQKCDFYIDFSIFSPKHQILAQ